MIFHWQARAKKDYEALPKDIRRKADKSLRLFARNPWHPSLHVEKIDHRRDIWSARVGRGYRFTFQWISGGIFLRRIGSHDTAYRKP